MKIFLPCLAIILTLLTSCSETVRKEHNIIAIKEDKTVINYKSKFNKDSAYSFIKKQVEYGPRVPGLKGHKNCKIYLSKKLHQFGFDTTIQKAKVKTFNNKKITIYNIIGSYKKNLQNRILLIAHWDTRPFSDQETNPKLSSLPVLGANDGASGVGVLLEVARQINIEQPNIGIDIIFFDGEDYGPRKKDNLTDEENMKYWCLGSQYWANNKHLFNYTAKFGILLDMVGVENARFMKESFSNTFAYNIVHDLWKKAAQIGYENYFINKAPRNFAVLDDHYFINSIAQIPTIDIIHSETINNSFHHSWHTQKDNMDVINKNTLEAVGRTLLTFINHKILN